MSQVDPRISGNVTINGDHPVNEYRGQLNFGRGIEISADISCTGDIRDFGNISCEEIYTTNTISASELSTGNYPGFVPNLQQISSLVQSMIDAAQEQAAQKRFNPVPFLTMIFLDHPIDDPNWLSGGSWVELTAHADLSAAFPGISAQLKVSRYLNKDYDEYQYDLSKLGTENKFRLPPCCRYIRCTDDAVRAGRINSSGVPNIIGTFGQLTPTDAKATGPFYKLEKKSLGPSVSTAKEKGWTLGFNARRAADVYGFHYSDKNLSAEVVPETLWVIPYYYVGGGTN